MKDKDFDEYINQKANEHSGLPYKEEYWNDMDSLLDTHMPTNNGGGGSSTKLKWGVFTSVCVSLLGFAIAYTQWNNTTPNASHPISSVPNQPASAPVEANMYPIGSSAATDNTNDAAPILNNSTSIDDTEKTATPKTVAAQNNLNSSPTTDHNLTATNIHQNKSEATTPNNTAPADQAAFALTPSLSSQYSSSSPTNTASQNQQSTDMTLAENDAQNAIEENIRIRQTSFETIERDDKTLQLTTTLTEQTILVPSVKKHHSFITGFAVSPFVGLIHEPQEKQWQKKESIFISPSQTNFIVGANMEIGIRQFSLRSGIGMSKHIFQHTQFTTHNTYQNDTSYVIVNPNFGTTQSGKPLILIKRQIDSTVVATEKTSNTSSKEVVYITIPLTMQYKVFYKKFTGLIEGGVMNHFALGAKQLFQSGADGNTSPIKIPAYQLQPTLGAGLRYALNSRLDIGAQYNYLMTQSNTPSILGNAHLGTFQIVYHFK